jgi:hypothetical protein
MQGSFPYLVRGEYVDGEVRFELPARSLRALRWFGALLIGFGLLFAWAPAGNLWEALVQWREGRAGRGSAAFALFELPFLIAGCIPILLGLLVLFGRCTVGWRSGELRVTERLGPFCWTRQMPGAAVARLEVSSARSRTSGAPLREIAGFAALAVQFADGSRRLLVLGYPKDLLLQLARQLREYLGGSVVATAIGDVERLESIPVAEPGNLLAQPEGSEVAVEGGTDRLRLVVPPAGVWRGSKGLFLMALFWCGMMLVLTLGFAVIGPDQTAGTPWFVWLLLLGFWLIGAWLLAASVNMGRRSAILEAERGRLRVQVRGIFGERDWEWQQAELAALRVGESGMEVNDVPVLELQVHPQVGNKVGLLSGRDEQELRWMAARLRAVLELPSQPGRPPG